MASQILIIKIRLRSTARSWQREDCSRPQRSREEVPNGCLPTTYLWVRNRYSQFTGSDRWTQANAVKQRSHPSLSIQHSLICVRHSVVIVGWLKMKRVRSKYRMGKHWVFGDSTILFSHKCQWLVATCDSRNEFHNAEQKAGRKQFGCIYVNAINRSVRDNGSGCDFCEGVNGWEVVWVASRNCLKT